MFRKAVVYAGLLIGLFFIICAAYLFGEYNKWDGEGFSGGIWWVLILQSIVFSAASFCAAAVIHWKNRKIEIESPFDAFVILSDKGEIKEEVALTECCSYAFGEYAVFNLVAGNWYVEAVSGTSPVGLRRENDTVIYKLKTNMPYKLSEQDVIYINNDRLLIR